MFAYYRESLYQVPIEVLSIHYDINGIPMSPIASAVYI